MNVEAIVLRRRDSGEADRRLTILTKDRGKIDVIAKGARKAASRLAGSSDPLVLAEMSLAVGKKNLFVTQAQPVSSFRKLRADFDRLSMGLALVELYAAVLPYEQPDPEAFELLRESLRHLESHEKPLVALVWAEVRLMEQSGFQPQLDPKRASVSPTAGGSISESSASEYRDSFKVKPGVLLGLTRIGEFSEPPHNMKLAADAARTLYPFWRHIADAALPANESLIRSFPRSDA